MPDSLLHQLERDVDLLLMEHTGNAASSKVTMAQTQSTGVAANPSSNTSSHPSPLVVERIRTLFAESLPIESLVLLREICRSHKPLIPSELKFYIISSLSSRASFRVCLCH